MVKPSLIVSHGDISPEQPLRNSPSLGSGNEKRLFKIFSRLAVMIIIDVVNSTVVPVGQPYASHEIELAVTRSEYVPGRTVSCLKDYDVKKYIVHNITVTENIFRRLSESKEFGKKKPMKEQLVVRDEKDEEKQVLWTAKV